MIGQSLGVNETVGIVMRLKTKHTLKNQTHSETQPGSKYTCWEKIQDKDQTITLTMDHGYGINSPTLSDTNTDDDGRLENTIIVLT